MFKGGMFSIKTNGIVSVCIRGGENKDKEYRLQNSRLFVFWLQGEGNNDLNLDQQLEKILKRF